MGGGGVQIVYEVRRGSFEENGLGTTAIKHLFVKELLQSAKLQTDYKQTIRPEAPEVPYGVGGLCNTSASSFKCMHPLCPIVHLIMLIPFVSTCFSDFILLFVFVQICTQGKSKMKENEPTA